MMQRELGLRLVGFILVTSFLVGCTLSRATPTSTLTATPRPIDRPTPASTPAFTLTPLPRSNASTTDTPTPDPCTGWWCRVTGIAYADMAELGSELGGASVSLYQSSYCSPTSGKHQTTSGPDGTFDFGQVFFHDTDRVRIEVAYEEHEPALWDSAGLYCLYCICFGSPIEMVIHTAPTQ